MSKYIFVVFSIALSVLLLGGGCSSPVDNKATGPSVGGVESPDVANNKIMINHFVFEPKEITVSAGTKVVWSHNDNVAHDVISPGLFKSQVMERGGEFNFTFDKAGEYAYYCSLHPSMTGKIIVK